MSWRESASQGAQDDLDGLLNVALAFAQQMLEKHGEFFPFAASIDSSGDVGLVGGDPEHEHLANSDVFATLVEGLQSRRSSIRAAALCADVQLSDSDAVRLELEHREGLSIAVLLPYKKKRVGRGIEYLPLQAGAGRHQVWEET